MHGDVLFIYFLLKKIVENPKIPEGKGSEKQINGWCGLVPVQKCAWPDLSICGSGKRGGGGMANG